MHGPDDRYIICFAHVFIPPDLLHLLQVLQMLQGVPEAGPCFPEFHSSFACFFCDNPAHQFAACSALAESHSGTDSSLDFRHSCCMVFPDRFSDFSCCNFLTAAYDHIVIQRSFRFYRAESFVCFRKLQSSHCPDSVRMFFRDRNGYNRCVVVLFSDSLP